MTVWICFLFSSLTGLLEVWIQLLFFCRFLKKKGNSLQAVSFLIFSYFAVSLKAPMGVKIFLFTCMLLCYGSYALKADKKASVLYAILTVEIMQLCYGVFNSLSSILSAFFYEFNPTVFSGIFMIAGELLSLGLSCLCYGVLLKYMTRKEDAQNQYLLLILIPLLLIFAVSVYISHTFYGNAISLEQGRLPEKGHIQMLIIQVLGVISIFSILYAYQKLSVSFSLRTKLSLAAQENHFQKQYVEEAQAHYRSTRSLRHDMKNHLLIIKGLLDKGQFEQAGAYIQEMDIFTASLSFPFQTGNPVLDVLLENKTALAKSKGITVSSSLKVPFPCPVGDMDFCIILANAMDNGIHACEMLDAGEQKQIHLSSRRQGNFLLLEIANTFSGNPRFRQGIGLSNIRWTAEKYGGAMDISIDGNIFSLCVLLVISQQP